MSKVKIDHTADTLHNALGIAEVREIAKKTGPITAEFMLGRLTNVQVAELLQESLSPEELLFLATMEIQGNAAMAAEIFDQKI